VIPGLIMLKRIFVLLILLCAVPAQAEDYAQPTWPNVLRTLVRYKALNLNEEKLLSEYAIVTECELYKSKYNDDFEWHKVLKAIRESVRMNVATFPTAYKYEADLQLDRYDFNKKEFNFTEKTVLKNVNAFVIYESDGLPCGLANVTHLPKIYRAVLDSPIYLLGIPLPQKDAEALLEKMKTDKNKFREVRAVFNFRVVYVEPLRKNIRATENKNDDKYSQSNSPDHLSMRLDVRLDSIDFYADKEKSQLFYSHRF
jgi:hypothetical protein